MFSPAETFTIHDDDEKFHEIFSPLINDRSLSLVSSKEIMYCSSFVPKFVRVNGTNARFS